MVRQELVPFSMRVSRDFKELLENAATERGQSMVKLIEDLVRTGLSTKHKAESGLEGETADRVLLRSMISDLETAQARTGSRIDEDHKCWREVKRKWSKRMRAFGWTVKNAPLAKYAADVTISAEHARVIARVQLLDLQRKLALGIGEPDPWDGRIDDEVFASDPVISDACKDNPEVLTFLDAINADRMEERASEATEAILAEIGTSHE